MEKVLRATCGLSWSTFLCLVNQPEYLVNKVLKSFREMSGVALLLSILLLVICIFVYLTVKSLVFAVLATLLTAAFFCFINHIRSETASHPHPTCQRAESNSTSNLYNFTISLSLYVLSSALVIFAIRRLRGLSGVNPLTDWKLDQIPQFWYSPDGVGVYNKTHIRQGSLKYSSSFYACSFY